MLHSIFVRDHFTVWSALSKIRSEI